MFRTCLVLIALVGLATPSHAAQKPRAQAPAATTAKSPSQAVINLNTATASELDRLPGIGAKTAVRIIEYRQKNGPFKKIEEILETSRSCPYSLSVFDLGSRPSVSRSR